MVSGQNQNDIGLLLLQGVDVLENGIGRSLVPALVQLLLRRDQPDELPQLATEDIPSQFNMTIEGNRLVLSEDIDTANIRVDRIAQGEIDNPIDRTKWDGRLCPISGEGIEPFSLPSC